MATYLTELRSGHKISWKWKLGVHCSTTAIINLLNYYQIDLDEDLVFGMGKGLGFIYFKYPEFSFPYISGRGNNLVENAIKNLGFSCNAKGGDFDYQLSRVVARLNNNRPTIIMVDMNSLDYISKRLLKLNEYYPFSEHHLLVVGYEYCGDNLFLHLQDHLWPTFILEAKSLKEAWQALRVKPFPLNNYYYEDNLIDVKITKSDLKKIVRYAIYSNAHEFMNPYNPVNTFSGVKGLDSFLRDFCRLHEIYPNVNEALNMIYLPLQKIGTGGGNFRRIYSRFLSKAASLLGIKELAFISKEYFLLVTLWQQFIEMISDKINTNTKIYAQDVKLLKEIVEREKKAIEALYCAMK